MKKDTIEYCKTTKFQNIDADFFVILFTERNQENCMAVTAVC